MFKNIALLLMGVVPMVTEHSFYSPTIGYLIVQFAIIVVLIACKRTAMGDRI